MEIWEKIIILVINPITNLNLVKLILSVCKELALIKNDNYKEFVNFVNDRPGHDIRHALDTNKIFNNLDGNLKLILIKVY